MVGVARDGQGQVRSAAAAGTTGRTPAFDSGGEKLRPSDRPSADSAQERRWLGSSQVAEALDLALGTVYRIKQRFTGEGLARALRDRPQANRHRKLDDRDEAHLVALACSPAPEGHDHWTLRLLAGKVVELGLASSMSHEGVRRRLKKTLLSRGRRRSGAFPG